MKCRIQDDGLLERSGLEMGALAGPQERSSFGGAQKRLAAVAEDERGSETPDCGAALAGNTAHDWVRAAMTGVEYFATVGRSDLARPNASKRAVNVGENHNRPQDWDL